MNNALFSSSCLAFDRSLRSLRDRCRPLLGSSPAGSGLSSAAASAGRELVEKKDVLPWSRKPAAREDLRLDWTAALHKHDEQIYEVREFEPLREIDANIGVVGRRRGLFVVVAQDRVSTSTFFWLISTGADRDQRNLPRSLLKQIQSIQQLLSTSTYTDLQNRLPNIVIS